MTAQPITSGQEKQFVRFVEDAARKAAEAALAEAGPDKDGLQLVIGRGDELQSAIREAAINALRKLAKNNNSLASWVKFYRDYFGLDGITFLVPTHQFQQGFDRLIAMPAGLTPNRVVAACRKHFHVYTYTEDLDAAVTVNERDPKSGAYIIRVRDRVEADEELKGLSANDIKERQLTTMTLLERLVYELKYFSETGKHLDVKNVTLCSGSRHSDGYVPRVYWDDDWLYVGWYNPDYADGSLRARAVIAATPATAGR